MIIGNGFILLSKIKECIVAVGIELPNELQKLLIWFEDIDIGRENRKGNGRCIPLFVPEILFLYNRTLNAEHRTNNHEEAAHRRLSMY